MHPSDGGSGAGWLGSNVAVVDGANGYIGSNLIRSFLRDGAPVVALSRSGGEQTRRAVADAVIAPEIASAGRQPLTVLDYSLATPDLGLEGTNLDVVFAQPCDYWHLAANVNFRPGNRDAVTAVNVEGTRTTVDAFWKHAKPGSRYFLVSTAYCCGEHVEQPVERWYTSAPPTAFRNFYEWSKREAELVVREAFESIDGVNGAVLRLGQIVGDSTSGRSTSDYGMYNLIRAVWAVARRKPHERIRIEGHPDATLHLVPVDACVRWMRRVADVDTTSLSPPIVHVVDTEPVPARDVVKAIEHHMHLRLSIASPAELAAEPTTLLERVVAARIAYTGSYLAQPFYFGRAHLDALTPSEPQVVDDDVLDRVVGSFMRTLRREAPPLE